MAKKIISPLPKSLLQEARKVINLANNPTPTMLHYFIGEKVTDMLFRKEHMSIPNNNAGIVLLKSKVLNQLYATNITAIAKQASGMMQIHDFDKRLVAGDITLVKDIANVTSRHNISFASKYCACHQPKLFPILDSIVRTFLAKVISKGNLKGYTGAQTTLINKFKNNYAYYKEVYDAFMKQYKLTSLTYRQVDVYIWHAHKLGLKHLDLFKLI